MNPTRLVPRIPALLWPRVSALFDEAMALPEGDCTAWLAALSTAQPDVAPHVQHLLRAHGSPRTLPGPEGELLAAALGAGVRPLAAGQLVGVYRLIEPLGEGGRASVRVAEQQRGAEQGLQRRVALKLPYAGLETPAVVAQRFAQERDLLATLEHPHIARLYDADSLLRLPIFLSKRHFNPRIHTDRIPACRGRGKGFQWNVDAQTRPLPGPASGV
jgi:eukaryotic-like serine/threonine-protein kinase